MVGANDFSTHNNDRDNDGDRNNDDEGVLDYGHAADARDRRQSIKLVTRYFAAAAAGDGRTACSLLAPFIAESTVEDYGHLPGSRGRTCATVLSKLFERRHAELARKQRSMSVIGVRVQGHKALAILDFPSIPEVRLIGERLEGRWRMQDLLDGNLE